MGSLDLVIWARPWRKDLQKPGIIIGYDLMESAIAALPKDIITIANDAPDAARDQDIVITMLPDGKSLASVAAEIIPVMRKGLV